MQKTHSRAVSDFVPGFAKPSYDSNYTMSQPVKTNDSRGGSKGDFPALPADAENMVEKQGKANWRRYNEIA